MPSYAQNINVPLLCIYVYVICLDIIITGRCLHDIYIQSTMCMVVDWLTIHRIGVKSTLISNGKNDPFEAHICLLNCISTLFCFVVAFFLLLLVCSRIIVASLSRVWTIRFDDLLTLVPEFEYSVSIDGELFDFACCANSNSANGGKRTRRSFP